MVGDFWTLKITAMKLGLREFKKRCIFEKFYFLKAIGYIVGWGNVDHRFRNGIPLQMKGINYTIVCTALPGDLQLLVTL